MKYKEVGKTKKLYNEFEEVVEGTVRLINNKLYSCTECFYGGYGYRKAIWKPLNINKLIINKETKL